MTHSFFSLLATNFDLGIYITLTLNPVFDFTIFLALETNKLFSTQKEISHNCPVVSGNSEV